MKLISLAWHGMRNGRRGVAAVEFAILAPTLMLMVFSFVALSTIFFSWSAMQNSAQYAALMVSTGQVKSVSSGALSSTNNSATTTCSSSLTSSEAEYYACTGLPGWGNYTVTTTENCAVPSVAVSISATGASIALMDIFEFFSGQTFSAQSVVMKEGQCP